jgi:hypothetical protein
LSFFHLVDFIAPRVRDLPIPEIFSVEFVERLPIASIEKILGPAQVSYADSSTFHPSPTDSCRLLTLEDTAISQSFAAALSTADLERSGFDFRSQKKNCELRGAWGTADRSTLRSTATDGQVSPTNRARRPVKVVFASGDPEVLDRGATQPGFGKNRTMACESLSPADGSLHHARLSDK